MPVIGCLEIFQNGRSPQPITGIIYSPGPHELKIGSAVEDTLGFIPLVYCIWGNKNWPSSMKLKIFKNLLEQNGLNGLQKVQFECPRRWKPFVSSNFGVG